MSTINLDVLGRPFSRDQIRQREGRSGKMLDYVEAHAVIDRLNEAFDGEWSFRIKTYWKEDEEVVVMGILSACGQEKQQFGCSQITRRKQDGQYASIGDDLKAAASDALKKCATAIGVALELYGRGDKGSRPTQAPQAPPDPVDAERSQFLRIRLREMRQRILGLPNGARVLNGVLIQFGVRRLEDLPEVKIPQFLAHCEKLCRSVSETETAGQGSNGRQRQV